MWLLLLFLLQGGSAPCQPVQQQPSGPPSLVVQAVDPLWVPLAGAEVTVKPARAKGEGETRNTNSEGYARFWLQPDADYTIEVRAAVFKKKRLKAFHVFRPPGTAYVQFRLEPSGPTTTVY
jgi:hypothetical protein